MPEKTLKETGKGNYVHRKAFQAADAGAGFRMPLEGRIELTYRCNHRCLHCWLWAPDTTAEKEKELTFNETRRIVDDARAMGCRRWGITGGEPLLREDFPDIFDYLTRKAAGYNIATNGTLITPEIARLLTRKGTKLVSIYGATAEVYDHVTRHPGGFAKAVRGINFLKEAGARFIVLLVPLRDNLHQWEEMVSLARNMSPYLRIGAPWLLLSCNGPPQRNCEIAAQRIPPRKVAELTKPAPSWEERMPRVETGCGLPSSGDDRLFSRCIANRREFHIDPYGKLSWCTYVKDPALRYNLRGGTFEEGWSKFIPSCADTIRGGAEWQENCGSCEKLGDCRWCPAFAYLETGRHSAPIPYLCGVVEEVRTFKQTWKEKHRRFFRIAGITVRLESELDLSKVQFNDQLSAFAVDGPGEDNVTIRQHFYLPDADNKDLGEVLYRRPPWVVSRKNDTWFYRGTTPTLDGERTSQLAVFSDDYSRITVYSPPVRRERSLETCWHSLTLFPTDQVWLAPLLAARNAVLLHSAAAAVNNRGLLFVGHSDAGKSTTMELLKAARGKTGLEVEILCDDRNIIRKWDDGWRVHGTWSSGTTTDVSPGEAPLQAILFPEQATENEVVLLTDRKLIWKNLLATLIRPMVTVEWWQKQLDLLEQLVSEVPCYVMHFDKSGDIVPHLERLTR